MRLLTHIYWTISQTLLGIRVNKGPFMLAVTLAALALTIPISSSASWCALTTP